MGSHSRAGRRLSERAIALAGLVLAAGGFMIGAGQLAVGIMALPGPAATVPAFPSPAATPAFPVNLRMLGSTDFAGTSPAFPVHLPAQHATFQVPSSADLRKLRTFFGIA